MSGFPGLRAHLALLKYFRSLGNLEPTYRVILEDLDGLNERHYYYYYYYRLHHHQHHQQHQQQQQCRCNVVCVGIRTINAIQQLQLRNGQSYTPIWKGNVQY